MASLEQEILQRIHRLNPNKQQRVLDFVTQLENEHSESALELIRLPAEERQRRVRAAIESASDEDFEIFEAYSEELTTDD